MTTIIASTNRRDSYSLRTATYYRSVLNSLGYDADILSLADLPESFVHPAMYGKETSLEFQAWQEKITLTTKFIFIIPEYNGSYPGILKLLVDACSYPDSFNGKKAILTGISTGKYGNIRGIDHFTGVCHYLNMNVMPNKLHIPYIHKEFDTNGNLFKEDTVRFTNMQINELIRF